MAADIVRLTTMPGSETPTEAEALHAIAALLTAPRSAAALAHYPTLRIQTTNLQDALVRAIEATETIIGEWTTELSQVHDLPDEFLKPASVSSAYLKIAPALVRNVHRTADFLLEESRPMPALDIDRVSDTIPSFSDFVRLGAAARAFLDAVVQTAYQLATFDGRQLNYKFLQSLLSFAPVAPTSLHTNIASEEIQSILNVFTSLSGKDRKNSSFTRAAHDQFPQRLLVGAQAAGLTDWRRRNLELVFSFCSDFVHSGYVSALAVGEPSPAIVMGGPGDAFTPEAENFAELKQRLFAECAGAYADLLLPVLRRAIGRTLISDIPHAWRAKIDNATREIGDIRAILERRVIEPIRRGLLGSQELLHMECMCGTSIELFPPHDDWDRFCAGCGSRVVFHELSDDVDYVISSLGAGDVLGGDATKIPDLSDTLRQKLNRIVSRHAPERRDDAVDFVLITDLERCDENDLRVPSAITSTPSKADKDSQEVVAFVSAKAIERCPTVRVTCNCGSAADYCTSNSTNIVTCPKCKVVIGLLGVAGGGNAVAVGNPDGTRRSVPIQARDRFSTPGVAVD